MLRPCPLTTEVTEPTVCPFLESCNTIPVTTLWRDAQTRELREVQLAMSRPEHLAPPELVSVIRHGGMPLLSVCLMETCIAVLQCGRGAQVQLQVGCHSCCPPTMARGVLVAYAGSCRRRLLHIVLKFAVLARNGANYRVHGVY